MRVLIESVLVRGKQGAEARLLLEECARHGGFVVEFEESSQPNEVDLLVSGRPGAPLLDSLPNVRHLVVPYAGLAKRTRALLLDRASPPAVYNLHHNAAATAEMAVALLLAASKLLVPMDGSLRQHDWTPRYSDQNGLQLAGRRALVLGYGAIGRRVAIVLHAMGMRVDAVRRRCNQPGVNEDDVHVHPPGELSDLLAPADAVILCLPATPETRGLLGAEELEQMEGAVLVNVSRGSICDEEALWNALLSGHLHSAGLDVWWEYPRDEPSRSETAPSRFPFETLDNVVMSPHRGGHVRRTEELRMAHLAELLTKLANGEEPDSRVDLHAGY